VPDETVSNDELLSPPLVSGDTTENLIHRLCGISEEGNAKFMPGWDWSVIISGLEGAVHRYDNSLGLQSGIAARIAVGEALWWISAADEFIRKRISNAMSLKEYSLSIQRTAAGRRLAGLVYLRNRAGHQLAAALHQSLASPTTDLNVMQDDGTVKVVTVTGHVTVDIKPFDTSPSEGYFFAPLNFLPPSDPNFFERYRRDACYEELVASKPVANVLKAVTRSLNSAISFEWTEGNIAVEVNVPTPP
jgi:hypothetical protein